MIRKRQRHPSRQRDLDRLLALIAVGAPDECWPFIGGTDSGGYGNFYFRGKVWKAHRASFVLHVRELEPGEKALHECDNPPCCNPFHVFAGTQTDNVADMDAKGRRGRGAARGEAHHRSLLTEEDVLVIFYDQRPHKRVAADYGISRHTVDKIKRGLRWAHVTNLE